ncbi:MAG: tRNA 4-thiouridine(8) synthase ThiI [Candidatus Desulfofervidaceae bacterium]|nr:tRNA 4-thiouridine(8) synthase ThiI [Candidatus Desulfofervidaceae bacterium]
MKKVLAIFSGGLDSLLAVCLIRQQGFVVEGVYFETPFFPAERARQSAKQINLPLSIVDITGEMLTIIKNPRFGYGSGLNPCLDCHLLMCKKACKIMQEKRYAFIISGEVLGQRPLSQTKEAMLKITKECPCGDYVLRPLSAKLLPPTKAEQEGWIDRNQLLDIKGRSRAYQIELAKKFGINDYPAPAGGCLLTDTIFAARLKDLLVHQEKINRRDLELLKLGRHFRLNEVTKAIVGRNQRENEILKRLSLPEDTALEVINYPGPFVLIPYGGDFAGEELASILAVSYSDAPKGKPAIIFIKQKGKVKEVKAHASPKEELHRYLIKKRRIIH